MRRTLKLFVVACLVAGDGFAQEFVTTPPPELMQGSPTPTVTPTPGPTDKPRKRSWFNHVLHPFGGGSAKPAMPDYKNPKLRGLVLDLQVSPQTIKLSEVRQLETRLTLTNKGKRAIDLDFPTDQRVEIYLMDTAEVTLTRWSDNHAINPKPGTLLINPGEHVEYNESISTRDLAPNKVFIVEVFLPKYPELKIRQKFLAAP